MTTTQLTITRKENNDIIFQAGSIYCLFKKTGSGNSDYTVMLDKKDKKGIKIFDAFCQAIKRNSDTKETTMIYVGFLQILSKYVTN